MRWENISPQHHSTSTSLECWLKASWIHGFLLLVPNSDPTIRLPQQIHQTRLCEPVLSAFSSWLLNRVPESSHCPKFTQKCCILQCLYNTHSYTGSRCVLLKRSPCPHCHVIPSYKAPCYLFLWPGIHVPNRTDLHLTGKTGRSRLRGSFFQPQKTHSLTLLFICLLIYCNWVIEGFLCSLF